MNKNTERRRHEDLARRTASWRSWAINTWWTNGFMAVELAEPFNGPPMCLDYECLCSTFDKNQHRHTVERLCTYMDTYEEDRAMIGRLCATLARISERRQASPLDIEEEVVESLTEPGLELLRARINKRPDAHAWVGLNRRYYELVMAEAKPDRWMLTGLDGMKVGDKLDPQQCPSIVALRGSRLVASVMPIACNGSALGFGSQEAAS